MLKSSKVKLGIAPIGWTNDDMPELGGEIPFEQCIKEISESGFIGTEVGSKYPKSSKDLLESLKPFNLSIASQWFSSFFTSENQPKDTEETIEKFKIHMNFLKELGAKVIVISEQGNSIQGQINTPLFKEKPKLDEDGWKKLASGLNTIGKIAIENKMRIVYHHHMGTVVQTMDEIDKLMDITDPKLVWLLADTGHIYYSDGNDSPLKLIKKYGDRIIHIHLKDIRENVKKSVIENNWSFLKGVKEGVFTVPGDGAIDFVPIFKVLDEIDYEGWLIVEAEQDPAKANPLEYAKKARSYIQKLTGL